jgi:hypothetical protein
VQAGARVVTPTTAAGTLGAAPDWALRPGMRHLASAHPSRRAFPSQPRKCYAQHITLDGQGWQLVSKLPRCRHRCSSYRCARTVRPGARASNLHLRQAPRLPARSFEASSAPEPPCALPINQCANTWRSTRRADCAPRGAAVTFAADDDAAIALAPVGLACDVAAERACIRQAAMLCALRMTALNGESAL